MGKCHSVVKILAAQNFSCSRKTQGGRVNDCVCFCSAFITIYGALNCVFLENAAAATEFAIFGP